LCVVTSASESDLPQSHVDTNCALPSMVRIVLDARKTLPPSRRLSHAR